jgi:hypothetical protein
MRVLIVDSNGTLTLDKGEIVIVLENPDAPPPAIRVYPSYANIKAWYERHDFILSKREAALREKGSEVKQ